MPPPRRARAPGAKNLQSVHTGRFTGSGLAPAKEAPDGNRRKSHHSCAPANANPGDRER